MITFQSSTKTKSRESTTAGNSSVSSNKKKSPKLSLKQALGQIRGPRRRRRASSIDTETTESEEPWPWTPSVMEFLTDICPEDILPKILAFAGPQKTAALSKVNSAWRDVIAEDSTWRVLCEDLYKWTPDQAEPVSWKDYYMTNPVVPTDYPTIHKALNAASSDPKTKAYQSADVRILVRPGRYYMPEAVTIRALKQTTQISVQGMKLPETFMSGDTNQASYGCNDSRVSLVSKTRLRNEPIFRVIRGKLILKDLCVEHVSMGIDIWSGNAAIHVQSNNGDMAEPPLPATAAKASAVLESVELVSHSGRGIVALEGAHLQIKDSYIHDCAATGVYVAGNGSRAVLEAVDVTENGMGNHQRAGGIARGHSGVYIDRGIVSITDCNVSRNSLSGIAVSSPGRTELVLKTTDILMNGNSFMDRLVADSSCQIDFKGLFNPRSTILMAKHADDDSDANFIEF